MPNYLCITKVQGAKISLALSLIFTIPYFLFLFFKTDFKTLTLICLTLIFFIGFTLQFARIIPPGEKGRLCFANKDLKVDWDDGFCLVPSLFPFLHYYDIYFLWNILVNNDYTKPEPVQPKKSEPINQTAMTMNWVGHSKVSAWQAFFANNITAVLYWFVDINPTNKRLVLQRIGTRIIAVCLIFAFIGSFFASITQPSVNTQNSRTEIISSEETKKTQNENKENNSEKPKVCVPINTFDPNSKLYCF